MSGLSLCRLCQCFGGWRGSLAARLDSFFINSDLDIFITFIRAFAQCQKSLRTSGVDTRRQLAIKDLSTVVFPFLFIYVWYVVHLILSLCFCHQVFCDFLESLREVFFIPFIIVCVHKGFRDSLFNTSIFSVWLLRQRNPCCLSGKPSMHRFLQRCKYFIHMEWSGVALAKRVLTVMFLVYSSAVMTDADFRFNLSRSLLVCRSSSARPATNRARFCET